MSSNDDFLILFDARQIYPNELEAQSDFNGFTDLLHTFDLHRGKRTGADEDDESRMVGQFKVGDGGFGLVYYRDTDRSEGRDTGSSRKGRGRVRG